jgi:hypothetical protein
MAKNEVANKDGFLTNLEDAIQKGIDAQTLNNFEKAFQLAEATESLNNLLTAEKMKKFIPLQGKKLGFKTDKVYSVDIIKSAVIEAVLTGVQVVGNQFNIIAGNCYITKEGFGYLLKNIEDLKYEIIPGTPKTNGGNSLVTMIIKWERKEKANERKIDFSIRVNSYMGVDAIIGKATRKARAWLYNYITDNEISDGDISDVTPTNQDLDPKNDITNIITPEEVKKTWREIVEDPECPIQQEDLKFYAEFMNIDAKECKKHLEENPEKVIATTLNLKDAQEKGAV